MTQRKQDRLLRIVARAQRANARALDAIADLGADELASFEAGLPAQARAQWRAVLRDMGDTKQAGDGLDAALPDALRRRERPERPRKGKP